jgi:hypothetical protein
LEVNVATPSSCAARIEDVSPFEYIHNTEALQAIFQMAKANKVTNYRHFLPIFNSITLVHGPVYYSKQHLLLGKIIPLGVGEIK